MANNDDEYRCEVLWKLTEDKKYNEMVDHVLTGCLDCITNSKRKLKGKEILYPDGPPPWIKLPEREQKDPIAWKKYEKKKVNVQMTPEEFTQFLIDSDWGDDRMVHEICKFKRIERIAAYPIMRDIRQKQSSKARQQEKEEKEVRRKEREAQWEAKRLKKADAKRKNEETRKQKSDEQKEYLEKMNEEEKLLDEEENSEESEPDEPVETEGDDEEKGFAHKKEYNLKNQMPWCPNTFDYLATDARSAIDHKEQKRMIAMCQNVLYQGMVQHASNKSEQKDVRKAIEAEYDVLVEAALEHAKKEACHPIDYLIEKATQVRFDAFQNRAGHPTNFLFKSPIFTVDHVEIPPGINSESITLMPKVEKVLRKPKELDELEIPDITKKCQVHKNKQPEQLKQALRNDAVAAKFVEENSVSVMMDATTACHLLSPSWEGIEYEFGIPILVEEKIVDGVQKKVVTLSKPNPYSTISRASLNRQSLKQMLKNQFVKRTATMKFRESRKKEDRKSKLAEKAAQSQKETDSQDSQASQIPAQSSQASGSSSPGPSTSRKEPSDSANDFLDNLIAGMDKTLNSTAKPTSSVPDIETGYQYVIFAVGDSRVLIRSRPPYAINDNGLKKRSVLYKDHSKQTYGTVSFEPRVEYLPSGGAMDLGAPEWVWNYTKRLFKMSDFHVLYRTSYRLDNVLQIDTVSMRVGIVSPPPIALGLLSARSLMLERFIVQLENLEVGEYLAYQEKDKPLVVVPKCDASTGVSTKTLRITEEDVKRVSNSIGDDFFHGFSPEIPFQWQIVQGRAPRMLLAKDSPILAHLPSRSNLVKLQRKKHTIKRKFEEREDRKNQEKRRKVLDLDDPNLFADFSNPSAQLQSEPYGWRGGRGARGRGRGGGRGRRGGRGRGARGGDGQETQNQA